MLWKRVRVKAMTAARSRKNRDTSTRPVPISRRSAEPGFKGSGRHNRLGWYIGAIALATGLAYSNSLSGPFIFDDQFSIVENTGIREWWRLGRVLNPGRELPTAGRPLVNLSFAINYALGGFDERGYHVVNIALHTLCALLVFGIVRRTLSLADGERLQQNIRPNEGRRSTTLAFAAALIWSVHPLNTEAVNYVTQRTELMMALFYLLTLYASLRAWNASSRNGRLTFGTWHVIAMVSCAAGMASKESMVTAPVMVVLYDAIFQFGSLPRAFKERWPFYSGLALSWIVLGVVLLRAGPRAYAGFASGVSPWTYLLNQMEMITRYLRLAVWPRSLVLNYGWPRPLKLDAVLPDAIVIVALAALTIVALVRQPRWGFLGVWFFLTLAPASSIVPVATEVGAERRMYLPLIGLVVLAVMAASAVRRAGPMVAGAALALVSIALAAGTFARNRDYQSSLRLAQTIVERYPTSVGHNVLGGALIAAGNDEAAIAELRRALPGDPRAYYPLGVELLKQAKWSEAIDALQAFLREKLLPPFEAVPARQGLGQAYAHEQRWREAIEQYRMVLRMNPTIAQQASTRAWLGDALSAQQHFAEAAVEYQAYLRLRPNDTGVLTHLGIVLMATDKLDDALVIFRRAVEIEPKNGQLQRNLATALLDHNDVTEAVDYARRAIQLSPGDPSLHNLLGRAFASVGKLDESRAEFERALDIDPSNVEASEDLRKLRLLLRR